MSIEVIRLAEPGDAAAAVAILRESARSFVLTPDEWLAREEMHPPRSRHRTFVAENGGVVVGLVQTWLDWWTTLPGACIAIVHVADRAEGIGIGTALWHTARDHLREVGGTRARAYFEWSAEGEAWARRRGFETVRYETLLEVDPRRVPAVPAVDGFRAVPLAEVADRPEQIYAIEEAAGEPSTVPLEHKFDEWLLSVWKNSDRDAGTAVLDGDRVVAVAFARFDPANGRGINGLAAVLPEYRNRGLAAMAKARTLRRAAELGIERMVASNFEQNAPMLAVNRRLGYRPFGRRVEMLGSV